LLRELGIRNEAGANNSNSCRYGPGPAVPGDAVARLDQMREVLLDLAAREGCGEKDLLVARGAIGGGDRQPVFRHQRIVFRQGRATAAGQAVPECAGGAVMTLDGPPLPYHSKGSLLNPDFLALGDGELPWREVPPA